MTGTTKSGYVFDIDDSIKTSNRFHRISRKYSKFAGKIQAITAEAEAKGEKPDPPKELVGEMYTACMDLEEFLLGDEIDGLEDCLRNYLGHEPTIPEVISELADILLKIMRSNEDLKKS